MDQRAVSNQKALIESGTMGTKGHVQVILPHLTVCNGSMR
jgi:ubiquitin-activating enzyme E1-like protein 2